MFELDAIIKNYFVSLRQLTEYQVSEAIDYSLERKISFEESLIDLKLLTLEQLGKCLSEIHNLPYYPLLQTPPTLFCKKILPGKLAEKWKVFPAGYNAGEDLLTIAIGNPDQIKPFVRIEKNALSASSIDIQYCLGSRD
jgi:uncharacterized protein (DUF433 family)